MMLIPSNEQFCAEMCKGLDPDAFLLDTFALVAGGDDDGDGDVEAASSSAPC